MKMILVICASVPLAGCGAFSATSMRCGVDGDASYVEIATAPQSIPKATRAMAELCGFAYEGDGNET